MSEHSKLELGNQIAWRAILIFGLVYAGIAVSTIVAKWIVALGIEWVSVSDIGMLVTGFWIMLAAVVGEFLTGRVFKHVGKN